jgi:hypothetical protein
MSNSVTQLPTAGSVRVQYPLLSSQETNPLLSLPSPLFVLPNLSQPRMQFSGLSAGQNDVYTVPTGRRLALGGYTLMQTSGSTGTVIPTVKIGGLYYPLQAPLTPGGTSNAAVLNMILEPGMILGFTCTTTTVNVTLAAFEFDSQGSNIRTVFAPGTAAGTPTIYTVAAGLTAAILGTNVTPFQSYGGTIFFQSDQASNVLTLYQFPAGQSADTAHKMAQSAAAGLNTRTTLTVNLNLLGGDNLAYSVTTPGAASLIFLNVLEY